MFKGGQFLNPIGLPILGDDMIQKGKCLNCWNEIYVHDCHFQCPHCGYAEN